MGGGKSAFLLWRLTCEGEVSEDQQAAAAEADGTARCGQPRQQEEAEGQFTRAQRRCSLQHTFHGCSKTTCTRRFSSLFTVEKIWNSRRLKKNPKTVRTCASTCGQRLRLISALFTFVGHAGNFGADICAGNKFNFAQLSADTPMAVSHEKFK